MATLYFWQSGALEIYIGANVSANLSYIGISLGWQTALAFVWDGLRGISPLLPWPVLLVILMRKGQFPAHRQLVLWLLVWLVAAALDVIFPLKFWRHYFIALLPPLCLAAGLTVVLLARKFARRETMVLSLIPAAIAIPLAVAMVRDAPITRSFERTNVPRAVATRIQQVGTNQHDIYVFNYDPAVYAYTGALPLTRFAFCTELTELFASSSGARPVMEVEAVLAEDPAWIVVAEPSPYEFAPEVLERLHAALRDYELDRSWRDKAYSYPPFEVQLYRRIGIRQDATKGQAG
jgi:hypothetical protein